MSGGVENVTVKDTYLFNVGQGLRIKAGLGRGGYVRNVAYERVFIDRALTAGIEINDFYGNVNPSCKPVPSSEKAVPVIGNISYTSVKVAFDKNSTAKAVDLEGLSETKGTIRHVRFDRVVFEGPAGSTTDFTCSHVEGAATRSVPVPSEHGCASLREEVTVS